MDMKNLLTGIACLFSISVWAQDSYYYCHGERIPLGENPGKVACISLKSASVSTPAVSGMALVNSVSDVYSSVRVYELPPSSPGVRSVSARFPASVSLQACYIAEDGFELIPSGHINVKLKSESDYPLLLSTASQNGCEVIGQNEFMPLWYSLRMVPGKVRNSVDIANAIYETGRFESSFPSFMFDALDISYDPDVIYQWGLYNPEYEGIDISISEAWEYATGVGIRIAIVDEGVELTHKDLMDNIYPSSYDMSTGTSPSKVYGDHGTHCAGIAAAVRNNGIQVAGVAPDAKIMSASIDFENTLDVISKLADGINWAWKNGADVISCSWKSPRNELIGEAIDNAVTKGREGKGCVFVKSAGNESGPITFPGDYSADVLAVTNMTIDGTINYRSCYGPNMLVAAPGTDILSTIRENRTARYSGTSMAAPHVAGLAALILERNPALTAKRVREIIARNAKKVGNVPYTETKTYGKWNEKYGYGLIDAFNSVKNTPRH